MASNEVSAVGAPQSPPINGGDNPFVKKLQAAGITKDQFEAAKAQGPDAVKALLQNAGIQPPDGGGGSGSQQTIGIGKPPSPEEMDAKLLAAGISEKELATAKAGGPAAMNPLFAKAGLQVPSAPPNAGGSFDLMA